MSTRRLIGEKTRKIIREELGIAIHTSLRKAGYSSEANTAWKAIDDMNSDEWSDILDFIVDGLP